MIFFPLTISYQKRGHNLYCNQKAKLQMVLSRMWIVIVGAALVLPACSFTDEALWPSLTGEDPADTGVSQAQQAPGMTAQSQANSGGGAVSQPPLGTSSFEPVGVTPGSPTGTIVGKKVVDLREELKRLQGNISQHNQQLQQIRSQMVQDSQRYHGAVAAINARLQVGTTPGNPILEQQFNNSLSDLDRLSSDIGEMNKLAAEVTKDSTMSAYLAESSRAAFNISGAVDEDHRQLAILEDEINRTVVLIDRLLKEVSDDIRRQTAYVSTERGNLNLLSAGIKSGEVYGASLTNRALASAVGGGIDPAHASDTTGRRPLVVIRFDRANVPYQQALYNAVSKVLEQRPNAVFDLVSIAPAAGGTAQVAINTNKSRRYAEGVLRSLIDMGLPPSRVALSGRTSSSARTNEVHLYIR